MRSEGHLVGVCAGLMCATEDQVVQLCRGRHSCTGVDLCNALQPNRWPPIGAKDEFKEVVQKMSLRKCEASSMETQL
jgi:hypothetical protein